MNDFLERRGFERRLEMDLLEEADLFDQLGGHELHLEEVLDRAGGIRRRRRTTSALVAAAAVVALVAPAGVLVADRDDAAGPGPAVHPTAPATTSASPAPTGVQQLADFSAMPAGPAPATGYVDGEVWHDPDGTTWQPPAASWGVLGIARIGDAFLVDTPSEELGEPTAVLVRRDGTVVHHWPMSGGFAVAHDGTLVAFAQPDGTPVVVSDGGAGWTALPRVGQQAKGEYDTVAVLGEDCGSAQGCTVLGNAVGAEQKTWASTSHGDVGVAGPRLLQLADTAPDGRLAGITKVDETAPGSCSEVQTPARQKAWGTCDHRFLSFSPDGSRLLASGPYADGLGDGTLDVLDARTGEPVVRYRAGAGGAFTGSVWEDDDHVLAVAFDGRRWAVLRLGTDGSVEVAVPPVRVRGADPTASPFRLPES